ncbi:MULTISPECIES: multidrug effflux MFS transporter [unclassified Kitasatospora]|uniref:multidrug effflux MFS transporter n=1 Tax=unclassified Kitasatospora TaxID=2633591 RepID=UPI0009EBD58D|nr:MULTISPECIES: multidrug effflux MFS transporter [unclassified Kitasatospora]
MTGPTAEIPERTTAADSTADGPQPGRATVVVLGSLVALGPLTTDLYLPAIPALAGDLGSTAPAVQLTLTASLFGLAIGQLVFGPLSDRLGRRRPLLAGMVLYTLSTLLCAFAGSVAVLVGGRFLQGLSGAAGLVIARAVARDRFEGVAMIRFMASLGLISGLAPIFAPAVGAQLLRFTDWRGSFLALVLFGAVLTAWVLLALDESLPPERRHSGGLGTTLRAIGGLIRDRRFTGYVLTSAFSFGALFAYVGGSSVVLQSEYQISPQTYSLIFAVNSVAVVGFSQLNGRVLVQRLPMNRLMPIGLVATLLAGLALVLFTTVWDLGLAGVWPALFLLMAGMGMVLPNSSAQALTMAPHAAGSASALIGVSTFTCGALVAPLSSLGERPSVALLGVVVAGCGAIALTAFVVLCRPWAKN